MKATRKLIPALALLLVSAVLLSTASYAWFTTNTSVDATMSVTVAAPNSLLISESKTEGWGTTIDLGHNFPEASKGYYPCSSADGKSFYAVDGAQLNGIVTVTGPTGENSSYVVGDIYIDENNQIMKVTAIDNAETDEDEFHAEALGTIKEAVKGNNFYQKEFYLLSPNDLATKTLEMSVKIENGGGVVGATGSLRVAITIGTETHIFAMNETTATVALTPDGNAAQKGTTGEAAEDVVLNGAFVDMISTMTSNEPLTVTVTIWYEGNDTDCISTNVEKGNKTDVTITFAYAA